MGKTFRFYTLLRPLRDRYVDDGSAVLTRVPVADNGQAIEVALIGVPSDARMIRVSISGIDAEPSYPQRQLVGIGSPDTELVILFLPLLTKVIQKHVFDAYKSDGTAFRAV